MDINYGILTIGGTVLSIGLIGLGFGLWGNYKGWSPSHIYILFIFGFCLGGIGTLLILFSFREID